MILMHIRSWRNGMWVLLAGLGILTARARDVQVSSDGVNLRLGPGNDHEVIAQAVKGQQLKVLGEEADWVRVVAPPEIDLWVHGELLDGQTANVPKLLMRTGPGSHCPAIGELVQGDQVVIRDRSGEWVRIEPNERACVWVNRQYVTDPGAVAVAPAPDADAVPETAAPVETSAPLEAAMSPAPEPAAAVVKPLDTVTPPLPKPAAVAVTHRLPPVPPAPIRPRPSVARSVLPAAKAPLAGTVAPASLRLPPAAVKTPPVQDNSTVYSMEGKTLLENRAQGEFLATTGEVALSGWMMGRPSRFVIELDEPVGGGFSWAYLMGRDSQLTAMAMRRVAIKGRLYWIQGVRSPVVELSEITPVP